MTEKERVSNLYKTVYNGHPWIDINILETLESISAEQAYTKVKPEINSIWEIVNHMIQWRLNVLQRVQGKIMTTPGHNYFTKNSDPSEEAWKNTLISLEESQQQWIELLSDFNESDFEKIYPNNNLTYYEHIHGIIQHDVYHLGQIVILKKFI
ncbi:DinB family protein [Flavobacterium sp. ZB4P13]|uniref:DinB family protein n=1 Tax=Flavobacterium sp. ZB4P13 TaxID=3401728 RepID=UPI003AAE0270